MRQFESSFLPDTPRQTSMIYEDEACFVYGNKSCRVLDVEAPWRPLHTRIARRFSARSVRVTIGTNQSLEFLRRIEGLRDVNIRTFRRLDWRPLLKLADVIESLSLSTVGVSQDTFDFTRFRKLRDCTILWAPEFSSILQCHWLERFRVWDSWELHELDLRQLVKLKELIVESCGQLHRIELADQAKIRSLKISQCTKLEIDLKRFVRDLEYLWLEGSIAFPLGNLALATHLKKVMLTFLRNQKTPVPAFMRKLPNLVYAEEVMTHLSEADRKIAKSLRAKWRAGPIGDSH